MLDYSCHVLLFSVAVDQLWTLLANLKTLLPYSKKQMQASLYLWSFCTIFDKKVPYFNKNYFQIANYKVVVKDWYFKDLLDTNKDI